MKLTMKQPHEMFPTLFDLAHKVEAGFEPDEIFEHNQTRTDVHLAIERHVAGWEDPGAEHVNEPEGDEDEDS